MKEFRSHTQIIDDAGGVNEVASATNASASGKVRFWYDRDSIPGKYWNAVAAAGFATLDELAAAAEHKRQNSESAA